LSIQPFDNSSPNVREPLIQVASNALEMIDLIEDFDHYETELREFNILSDPYGL